MAPDEKLVACDSCGQIQTTPPVSPLLHPYCVRCETSLAPHWWHNQQAAAALALSALTLFVPSILLPLMRLETLGQSQRFAAAALASNVLRRAAEFLYF